MRICIGIDQSYKNTGWSICLNDKIVKYGHIDFKGLNNNSDKRKEVANVINQLIQKSLTYVKSEARIVIVVERIRLRSQGFLNIKYIQSTAGLICTIIDVAHEYNIPVYSVDTRSWKSQIVGNAKGRKQKVLITKGKNKGKYKTVTDNKIETMEFVKNKLGIDVKNDDDVADAICISKYAFLPKSKRRLVLEQ